LVSTSPQFIGLLFIYRICACISRT
jgi:hypothetical protein